MKNSRIITVLALLIIVFSGMATVIGITSNDGPGKYDYMFIRGENITIYGIGIYRHN